MRFFYLLLFFYSFSIVTYGQLHYTTTPPDKPVTGYLTDAGEHALVFMGREHEKYPIHYANHPWLHSPEFVKGTLYYNGVKYTGIEMKLDLYRNELVISPSNAPFSIVPEPGLVDSALLNETQIRYFAIPMGGMPAGYAVMLHNGNNRLYQKHRLILRDVVESGKLITRFEILKSYWLVNESGVSRISRVSDLNRHFPDQRRLIRTFLKSNQLNFRRNPEQTLAQLLDYLD
jgi:hypothetical protein